MGLGTRVWSLGIGGLSSFQVWARQTIGDPSTDSKIAEKGMEASIVTNTNYSLGFLLYSIVQHTPEPCIRSLKMRRQRTASLWEMPTKASRGLGAAWQHPKL